MKTTRLFLSALLLLHPAVSRAALTAQDILTKADAIRMPKEDCGFNATVTSKKADGKEDEASYEVLLKGTEKTLIKTLSPSVDRGTSILMLGHDLWVFLPSVEKPLRISLQQRLLGDVANGDLARANFVGDYIPTLVAAKPNFYVLSLRAKNEEVTYGSIKLWVETRTFRPLKAAFYASSGRLLKVGSYENYKSLAGQWRPSKLIFTDAVVRGQVSTIRYDDISIRTDLADKYFTKDYLKKLKY